MAVVEECCRLFRVKFRPDVDVVQSVVDFEGEPLLDRPGRLALDPI